VRLRVVVIEDNPDNQQLVSYLLRGFGHEPLLASGGAEGVELARAERPDLVLLDLHMPGMDGYETAARIRAHPELEATPVVAVTALAMVGDREAVLARGFDGYISKPIDPESFVGEIEAVLQRSLAASETGGG
jgi:CheY-like chemotaxis protein